ncbi:hypothetical protein [Pseudomonas protegens]|uniref:hypothetical protein n=1 Tax=Pseudomonas protegens TaxID=380021 RepID=UPI001B31DB05|nr:hypothetical protein [Pseudomonas protegens]MBP5103784.1 hypothetical protein [Pseudomonas protegens]MBP5132176.1 hypothetical protein [Pseudomonas protegens]MBP5149460.1 hypothetical protein [Pseudomonas protegens]
MQRTRTLPRLSTSPLLALLLGLSAGAAQAASLSQSLMECQPSFFKALYQQRAELGQVVKLAENQRQGIAWIPVAERRDSATALMAFSRPLLDQGLPLSAYYDRQFDLGEQGTFHFWGFEIDASREAVMAALPQAGWQETGEYFVSRPQIKLNAATPWQDNPAAASGIAPAPGSAEKILMLSQEDGKTRLLCSLQGTVDQPLLEQERPDLAQGAGR